MRFLLACLIAIGLLVALGLFTGSVSGATPPPGRCVLALLRVDAHGQPVAVLGAQPVPCPPAKKKPRKRKHLKL